MLWRKANETRNGCGGNGVGTRGERFGEIDVIMADNWCSVTWHRLIFTKRILNDIKMNWSTRISSAAFIISALFYYGFKKRAWPVSLIYSLCLYARCGGHYSMLGQLIWYCNYILYGPVRAANCPVRYVMNVFTYVIRTNKIHTFKSVF